ncbi:GSCOCT00005792001.2-RA-CDS [Cotesia congregata]|uniref:Venom protein 100-6 n=1 Tax=Cotesia congregata TaxID=51543 RepID=A0A8J2MHN0_COTCN|nr:GSCOCT00005792001.2-RA-CDS [Cotesia congregata]CAG5083836.1 Putative venom protein 100-6 [Cotesia congregata]
MVTFSLKNMGLPLLAVIFFTVAAVESSNNKKKDSIRNQNSLIKNMEYGLYMLQNMNASVDPCDNFYEFACGDADDKSNKYYDKADNDMDRRIEILITDSHRSFKFEPFKFISDYYYSCKNLKKNHDDTELLNELISKLGGWPVLEGDKWDDTDFNWEKYVEKAISIGIVVDDFYNLNTDLDEGVVKFELDPPVSRDSESDLSNNKLSNAYFKFMSDVAIFLGADIDQTKELKLSLEFGHDINTLYYSKVYNEDDYNPVEMSVKEMIEKWPSIDWIRSLSSNTKPYYNFTNETNVHIEFPNFITHFEKLLNRTPKRVQANYLVWNFIELAIRFINSKTLWDYSQTYKKIRYSYTTKIDQIDCKELVKTDLNPLLQAYYIREYPVEERTKSEFHAIYSNVKNKFIEIVNSSKWLDSNTKIEIIDKVASIQTVIGYPDELLNDDQLKNYFEGLEITRDNFYKNYLNAKLFEKKIINFQTFNKVSSVKTGVDLFTFMYEEPNNAMYDIFDNFMSVSIELLRNYFFDVERFNYLNYGVIGGIIGHELSHAVDSENRLLKKTGLRYKWSHLSNDEYQKKETCMINQYKINYPTENEIELKAAKYLSENIADNIGTKIAYLAYQDWIAINGHEPNLPGLSYTPNQLFWISFANQWCQPKSVLSNWDDDDHASDDKRVIGTVSNSIEFSKDFNCPVGSNMNPSNKCIFF